MTERRGVGVSGELGREAVADLAALAEDCGYDNFWINVNRRDQDPVGLVAAAAGRTKFEIGVGVFPLDRYTPDEVAEDVAAAGLSDPRFIFCISSGRATTGILDLDRRGIEALRKASPKSRVGIGGYGPKVLALSGAIADVVNINWMTPERVGWATEQIAAGAREAGRPMPALYLYHRVAQGPNAADIIADELTRYRSNPVQVKHQATMGDPHFIGIAAMTREEIAPQLAPYLGICIPVIKPKPADPTDVADWKRLVRFFSPKG